MEATSAFRATEEVCRTDFPLGYAAVLGSSLRRLACWRIPPNWSAPDWFDEVKAIGAAAIWQAQCEFDASYGVPISAFLHQRILARVFTRYRQEWSYALHVAPEVIEEPSGLSAQDHAPLLFETTHEPVRDAIDSLRPTDRQIVERLFWQDKTESQLARSLGISQSAVSKRKHAILRQLRSLL